MRVLLSVPILVSGKTTESKDFKEETRTLVVNAHGALISLAAQVAAGQNDHAFEQSDSPIPRLPRRPVGTSQAVKRRWASNS